MNGKHAAGPWAIEEGVRGTTVIVGPNEDIVTRLPDWPGYKATQAANAALIAAAPTMDVALRSVLCNLSLAEKSGVEIRGYLLLAREAASAAIAKAEGR